MNQEYKTQEAQHYADAQRYAKEWGISPEYYLSVQPYFFVFYGHVEDVPGLVKACYKLQSEGRCLLYVCPEFEGDPYLFWLPTLMLADHPEAGVELFERCTDV